MNHYSSIILNDLTCARSIPACGCDEAGAVFTNCTDQGQCQCRIGHTGKTCNSCKVGYIKNETQHCNRKLIVQPRCESLAVLLDNSSPRFEGVCWLFVFRICFLLPSSCWFHPMRVASERRFRGGSTSDLRFQCVDSTCELCACCTCQCLLKMKMCCRSIRLHSFVVDSWKRFATTAEVTDIHGQAF